jgi:hypothetical protein
MIEGTKVTRETRLKTAAMLYRGLCGQEPPELSTTGVSNAQNEAEADN